MPQIGSGRRRHAWSAIDRRVVVVIADELHVLDARRIFRRPRPGKNRDRACWFRHSCPCRRPPARWIAHLHIMLAVLGQRRGAKGVARVHRIGRQRVAAGDLEAQAGFVAYCLQLIRHAQRHLHQKTLARHKGLLALDGETDLAAPHHPHGAVIAIELGTGLFARRHLDPPRVIAIGLDDLLRSSSLAPCGWQ